MHSYSRSDSLKINNTVKRHGVGVEIGGGSLTFSLNYRYQIICRDKVTLGASIGLGYLFDQITRYELLSIPLGVEAKIRLKRKIYLINKFSSALSICKNPYPNDYKTRKNYIKNKINDGTEVRRSIEPVYGYFLGINFSFRSIDFSFGPTLLVYKNIYNSNPYFAPWAGFNFYYKF